MASKSNPKMLKAVNTYTGETYEYSTKDDNDLAMSYEAINQTIKALERLKLKIRYTVLDRMDDDKWEVAHFTWQRQVKRYMNYDLTVLRDVVDEDLYHTFVKPDKSKIEQAMTESVDSPHPVIPLDAITELRKTMIEERPPVTALRLERIK